MCWNHTSKCKSFEVIKHLLKVAKIAISHLIVSPSPANLKNVEGHQNSVGLFFEKKSVTAIVLEQSAWHTNGRTHAKPTHPHTHAHTDCISESPVPGYRPVGDNNGRGLIDVTTPTETNGDLSIRTIFGCGSGFGYGRRLRGVVCPLLSNGNLG